LHPVCGIPCTTGEAHRTRSYQETNIRWTMPAVLSLLLVIAALYALLVRTTDLDLQRWATGVIGTVTGFWFGGRAK
jgi:hypothetical protein